LAAGFDHQLLAEWDRRYTKDNRRAALFETAMEELNNRTWDELLAGDSAAAGGRGPRLPEGQVLLELMQDPTSKWWDDRRTPGVVETRDAILTASLRAALVIARKEYGDPAGDGWLWSNVRHANIYHLARIPALSALGLPVQGGPSTLSPSGGTGTQGPSWRMVVELGPEVRAWATYPGGQSGNPASPFYRDRLKLWLAGQLAPILFPKTPAGLDRKRVISTLTLEPR